LSWRRIAFTHHSPTWSLFAAKGTAAIAARAKASRKCFAALFTLSSAQARVLAIPLVATGKSFGLTHIIAL
jgi:hypothetical protein